MLTDKQIESIKKIIKKHLNLFLLSTLGSKSLDTEELRFLQSLGLLNQIFKDNLFKEAFKIGRKSKLESKTDSKVLDQVDDSSKHYTKKLVQNITDKLVGTLIEEQKKDELANIVGPINIDPYEKQTYSVNRKELANTLEKITNNTSRDWERIVTTEIGRAYSQGAVHSILESNPGKDLHNIMVYMEGPLDAATCVWCRRFYHNGKSFKIYRLSELLSNGTNVGRKNSEWKAVVPPMHPRCRHRIVELPQGYSLDKNGKLYFVSKYHHELNNPTVLKSLKGKVPTFTGWKLQDKYSFQGMNISIENKTGSFRKWKNRNGAKGKTKMLYDYGYIRNTLGTDGDHVDCYIGPNENAENAFIIHQVVPSTGKHDEEKVMLGFDSAKDAKKAYLKHYNSPDFFGGITTMPIDEFKQKVIGKETDIIKGQGERSSHKYLRREGGPGNYKYIYKNPVTGKEYAADKPINASHAQLNADQPANDFFKPKVKVLTITTKKPGIEGWAPAANIPNMINHSQYGTISVKDNENGSKSLIHNGAIKNIDGNTEFHPDQINEVVKNYANSLGEQRFSQLPKKIVVKKV